MALLRLENIGKIYVSEGAVAVGIRHVNLEFDIGEFVAVTGKSGSGKTTLLNVISGMDTYEEGELYVEGESTSHYSQADWEAYREKYISFIFQDYNIIDSFTVLQNVELALSDIESKKERRRRALELIDRVGLTPFKNRRGAKLSGGQKQRTVIARALAKDSPVILADEPTGNLDAKSSEEVVALLAEIAREKLVIVVTHSFAQLEAYATREVRIFDGAIERDAALRSFEKKSIPKREEKKRAAHTLRRAAELGAHRFFSVPKLSIFMCLLMVIAMLGTFFVTALMVADLSPVGSARMFSYLKGRVVLVRQDGKPIADGELEALAASVGADHALHYDALLDHTADLSFSDYERGRYWYASLAYTNDTSIKPAVGRLPAAEGEALLELPIEFCEIFGKDTLLRDTVTLYDGAVTLKVSGVAYYYDNTRENGSIVLTDKGFEAMSAADYLCGGSWQTETSYDLTFTVTDGNGVPTEYQFSLKNAAIDNTLHGNTVAAVVRGSEATLFYEALRSAADLRLDLVFTAKERDSYASLTRTNTVTVENLTWDRDHVVGVVDDDEVYSPRDIAISPELAAFLMSGARNDAYTQGSLFFASDAAAKNAVDALRAAGYVPVLSSATYENADEILVNLLGNAVNVFTWALLVFFLAVFVALCSSRAMSAKRGDLAILRSMGIPNRVIKLSAYAQTALSLCPALLLLVAAALVCYLTPRINPRIPFLHAPQYVMIVLGLVAISLFVTGWHNRRMFRDSVRKTMRGEDAK